MQMNELLHGEKVHLAALTKADFPQYQEWFSQDVDMMRLLNPHAVYMNTPEAEREWLNQAITNAGKDNFLFSVRTLDDDRLLGNFELFQVNWVARMCTVGIAIADPTLRGKGYGTDAMRIGLRFAFMELNLNRVMLEVYSYNLPAIRSYEKVGFVEEGRLRDKLRRDGEYHDIVQMSILRREWLTKYHSTS